MSNMVTVKQNGFDYKVPMHEFVRYWLPGIDQIEVARLPDNIPYVSRLCAMKRGKKDVGAIESDTEINDRG